MTARDTILASIRRSLGVSGREAPRRKAVADRLREHPPGVVPARGKLAPKSRAELFPRLAAMPWQRERTLEVKQGASDGNDLAAVSHAFGAVAESGTLMLTSGKDNPTTLNFLPDTHIVVVDADDVAGDYETLWRKLRERFGAGAMPRTVNWITGPSRSADIEQTLILGAHGPRRLHVMVVGETE
ncbi:MAG: lactate utilization protein [Alphaproteobacteria bacterium]|nr:MAG: lactate utilization protein [Alphaproteobacteria bacterium]